MKNILIITSSIDYTVDYIIKKYNYLKFFRLNVDMLSFYNIVITEKEWTIATKEWAISCKSVDSIYYRKPRLPNLSDYEVQYINMIQKDIIATIEGIVNSFDGYVLSKPYILHCCENKIYQLQFANKIGFNIPISSITNDTNHAKKFVNKSTVVKPLTTGKIIFGTDVEIFQTNIIKEINQDIQMTPIYLQEYVNKKYEVRATFVGKILFCVKIVSSNQIDWRDEKAVNKYSIIEMPSIIYNKCIELMKNFEIDFGAFDFIVDYNDDWIFLEVNPNGQWLWLEKELGINISDEIINLLNGGIQ